MFTFADATMGTLLYVLIFLSGALYVDRLEDFQKVEQENDFCKLDCVFKNISSKYEQRKYLGSFAAFMINANNTSTYHLLLLLSNDINPNPGPTSLSTENFDACYTREELLQYRTKITTPPRNLLNKIN